MESATVNRFFRLPFQNMCGLPQGSDAKSINEWIIFDMSKTIRTKPNWQTKYKDSEIVNNWKKDFLTQFKNDGIIIKHANFDDLFEYTIKELSWYEKLEKEYKGNLKICMDDRICSSETLVNGKIKANLKTQSIELEKSFGDKIDYHPGSQNQVIDLVHPSLFPLVYGKSQSIDPDTKEISVIDYSEDIVGDPDHKYKGFQFFGSKNFQWLPTIFELSHDKKRYEITSYINNLEPKSFKDLYKTIEDVFNASIPALNFVLSRLCSPEYIRIPVPGQLEVYTEKFQEEYEALLDSDEGDYETYFNENAANSIKDLSPTYNSDPITNNFSLPNEYSKLKVIVKMANIELMPENPVYPGGSWHVEGALNEDIVATVLYYYDTENITDSELEFRADFEDPLYEQDDKVYCKEIFGIEDEKIHSNNLGGVKVEEGMLLVFPNIFQHHVKPFELKDKGKKGTRKILCFFLVDPGNKRNFASDTVLPQQKEWLGENSDEIVSKMFKSKNQEMTYTKELDFEYDLALEMRAKLMKERSNFFTEGDSSFSREFCLCEH
ncbi:hypothetical protein DASC09_048420 [Saccharomycopsis crataegensis]|uniref:Fe2OG dioxygenase domain-containing protein n=1 Tax=Saccharomycopsis crataegensis TaxID=43959 RepID=A0AAV5QSG1_9ASCO|nr:hypothetical protein DASC09_048420 [Saccharomycopsis crataegensis]